MLYTQINSDLSPSRKINGKNEKKNQNQNKKNIKNDERNDKRIENLKFISNYMELTASLLVLLL